MQLHKHRSTPNPRLSGKGARHETSTQPRGSCYERTKIITDPQDAYNTLSRHSLAHFLSTSPLFSLPSYHPFLSPSFSFPSSSLRRTVDFHSRSLSLSLPVFLTAFHEAEKTGAREKKKERTRVSRSTGADCFRKNRETRVYRASYWKFGYLPYVVCRSPYNENHRVPCSTEATREERNTVITHRDRERLLDVLFVKVSLKREEVGEGILYGTWNLGSKKGRRTEGI